MSFIDREDKLKEYLKSELEGLLFSELDNDFLKAGDLEFMAGVPFPIKQEDLKSFTESGLSTTKIADNMALVIGADIGFKYTEKYISYLRKLFDEKIIMVFSSKGKSLLERNLCKEALCYFRAAMLFNDESLEAMYSYAAGCRYWYLSMEGEDEEELISLLKSESMEYFIKITDQYTEFAPAWYYLGYAYLNSGAYKKADLSFKHYMENSEGQPEDAIKEVKERIDSLVDPVKIEEGINLLVAGKIEESLRILESYIGTEYDRWWPLHFYLGTAYKALGFKNEAIEGFLKVLEFNPSNYDAMTELASLYDEIGDMEKANKYRTKAQLVLN